MTDHRAEADRIMREHPAGAQHLLAAIHDGQREQTALLRALVEQAMPESEPTVDLAAEFQAIADADSVAAPADEYDLDSDGHRAVWNGSEYRCVACDAGPTRAPDPEPESVTVTLPRDVAIRELCDAIRLTVEYVGTETLPPIEGWSWFDALSKYAPDMADALDAANGSQS